MKDQKAKTNKGLIGLGIAMLLTSFGTEATVQNPAEFTVMADMLTEWTDSALFRLIGGAMILVGIISGIASQNIMTMVLGLAGGMALLQGPKIIASVVDPSMNGTTSVIAEAKEEEKKTTVKELINKMSGVEEKTYYSEINVPVKVDKVASLDGCELNPGSNVYHIETGNEFEVLSTTDLWVIVVNEFGERKSIKPTELSCAN